jgi:YesN/AraC family two-component response regulator
MAEKWYEGLGDDAFLTETDKAYEKAISQIREGIEKGLDFDSACAAIKIDNEELKEHIIDDMLKVIIAEEHYNKNVPLDALASAIKISVERLEAAKSEMLEDVKNSSIKAFYKGLKPGNA